MRVYGSINNRFREASKAPIPEIGMGATEIGYSDRHACTIVELHSFRGKRAGRIGVQRDTAVRTDNNGESEVQKYEYTPNPAAQVTYYTYRINGTYVQVGDSMDHGTVMQVGTRSSYRDFSH